MKYICTGFASHPNCVYNYMPNTLNVISQSNCLLNTGPDLHQLKSHVANNKKHKTKGTAKHAHAKVM